MNREPEPCGKCARFRADRCDGYEKPRRADETNEACPLWIGKSNTRQRPRRTNETISRASASKPAVAGTTT